MSSNVPQDLARHGLSPKLFPEALLTALSDDATGPEVVEAAFAKMRPHASDAQFSEFVAYAAPNAYGLEGQRAFEGKWMLNKVAYVSEEASDCGRNYAAGSKDKT